MSDNRKYGHSNGGSSSDSSTYAAKVTSGNYDKKISEESPLIPRAGAVEVDDGGDGAPSATWAGAADFEGVHWTRKPSVSPAQGSAVYNYD